MNAPGPTLADIRLTQDQVRAVATALESDGDEQLKLDMLEGETSLFELVRALLEAIEADEGNVAALDAQIEQRQARKGAADHRNEQRRKAIMALLRCAGLPALRLPEATLSVRDVPPKPIVTDETAVPDALCKLTRKPDMAAIKAELEGGAVVPGVSRDNGGVSLTIRRK